MLRISQKYWAFISENLLACCHYFQIHGLPIKNICESSPLTVLRLVEVPTSLSRPLMSSWLVRVSISLHARWQIRNSIGSQHCFHTGWQVSDSSGFQHRFHARWQVWDSSGFQHRFHTRWQVPDSLGSQHRFHARWQFVNSSGSQYRFYVSVDAFITRRGLNIAFTPVEEFVTRQGLNIAFTPADLFVTFVEVPTLLSRLLICSCAGPTLLSHSLIIPWLVGISTFLSYPLRSSWLVRVSTSLYAYWPFPLIPR